MRPAGLLWLLLGVLGAGLVVLILRHQDGDVFGMPSDRFAQLVLLVSVLAFVGIGVVNRGTFGKAMRYAIGWGAVMALLIAVYANRDQFEWLARGVLAELVPGQPVVQQVDGEEEVIVARSRGGHFRLAAEINGARMPMLVDTGASVVTLTARDAIRAGINLDNLRYTVPVMTANGSAAAAPVMLDVVSVGPIERHRVRALVTRPGMLDTSLLGMSFLDSLTGYAVRGNQLTLTP